MKLIRLVIAVVVIFISPAGFGQSDSSFRFLSSIGKDIVSFTVDYLDNIYLVSASNQVKKLDRNGDSVAVYNDVRKYGKVSMLDVSNPMRVLLFYRDFSTVVLLDRFLAARSSIDLRRQGLYQVEAIGLAYDNSIWVFDEVNRKLKKLDEEGNTLLETPDFRQMFDSLPSPDFLFDRDGLVYLYDTARGIIVFDYYGALKNNLHINGLKHLQIYESGIYGVRNDTLEHYDMKTFVTRKYPLPLKDAELVKLTGERLYIMKGGVVYMYGKG